MSKKSFLSNTSYPIYAKIWFIVYLALNFLFGISFFYTQSLKIPYIVLALINIYGIALLMKENRQGFYTLCSSEIIFLVYTLITKQPSQFITITVINFLLLLITWICVRGLWDR